MMVAIYHFTGWRWSDVTWVKWSNLLINGSDAVAFFFVLSGFVLSYKYFHKAAILEPWRFFLKRIWRLYPAYIITVLICYAYYTRASGIDGFLHGFIDNGNSKIWSELFMVRQSHLYYTPGWSLGVEMGLSVLLPLLVFAAKANIKYTYLLTLFAVFVGPYFINPFVIHFTLGVLVAYHYKEIHGNTGIGVSIDKYKFPLLIIGFLLFSARHINKLLPFGTEVEYAQNFMKVDYFFPSGLGAAILMVLVINDLRARKLLSNGVFHFIGKISYSIYLCHWVIVWSLMDNYDYFASQLPDSTFSPFLIFMAYILAVISLSFLFYKLIEEPAIKLSRKWFKKQKTSLR